MDALNHIINYLVSFFNTRLTVANFVDATYETLIMVLISLIIGALLGIPLGICLVTTRPSGLLANRGIYNLLNPIINMVRSLPFIILMVAIAQFTALIVGKSYGVAAAIVPLTIYVTPYIARLVENSL